MKKLFSLIIALAAATVSAVAAHAADEIHWTFTGPTSVSFDWRGSESSIRYGLTSSYGQTASAYTPSPLPFSSSGPFWEARITGLKSGTTYHYQIGSSADHTFQTPPTPGSSNFTVMAEGDIGSSRTYTRVDPVQQVIADQKPAFTLVVGDITYANAHGQPDVDQHFNDVMLWSLDAAYMPTWGNHEWDSPSSDDLRNYKGRFDLPNPQSSSNAPSPPGPGEDWSWFDYGNVRFISLPEPYSSATWTDWLAKATPIFADAQANPSITFIVTTVHRPAYSSGNHAGSSQLASYMGQLGAKYSKYKLDICGHSHDYERSYPQSGVIHITAGTGGATLEEASGSCLYGGGCPPPAWSAFRAMHHGALRLTVTPTSLICDGICGPAGDSGSNRNDITCTPGSVFDHVVIAADGAPVVNQAPNGTIDNPAANVTITAGQSVTFAGTGTDPDGNTPLGYLWDFAGGAANQNVQDPGAVVFANPGTYQVTFTVTDSRGTPDPTPGTRTITVQPAVTNQPPDGTIAWPAADTTVTAGGTVTFAARGSDPDGNTPLTYAWNFGGAAGNGSGQALTRTLATAGTFTVTMTAKDAAGLPDPTPATRKVTVVAGSNAPPSGRIVSPAVDTTVTQGATVTLRAAGADSDGDVPLSYAWDLGGAAANASGPSPSLVFATGGVYKISMTVSDASGEKAPTVWRTVMVLPPANHAPDGAILSPLADTTIVIGSVVTFRSQGTDPDGDALTYAWNFGGGASNAAVQNPMARTWSKLGAYKVTLTVTDAHGLADPTPATRTITVLSSADAAPTARIVTPAADTTIERGWTVRFHGVAQDPDDASGFAYAWDFGGGAPASTLQDPAPKFATNGTFDVTLTVTDPHGVKSAPAHARVQVLEPPNSQPIASIASPAADDTVAVGQQVEFVASVFDNEADLPLVFAWNFGGAAPSTAKPLPDPVTFTQPGSYTITLVVTDARGLSSAPAMRHITVISTPNQAPIAVLDVTPASGAAPLAVHGSAASSRDPDGRIVSYRFDCGDGTVIGPGTTSTFDHAYAAGVWHAQLIVTDDLGARDTAFATVTASAVIAGPNLVLNPSFEKDTHGWGPVNGANLARVPGDFAGSYAARAIGPKYAGAFGITDSPNWISKVESADVGRTLRVSAWVRATTRAGTAQIQVREMKDSKTVRDQVSSAPLALTADWQLVTVDAVLQQQNDLVDLRVMDNAVGASEVMLVDQVAMQWVDLDTSVPVTTRPGSGVSTAPATAAPTDASFVYEAVQLAPNPFRGQGAIGFSMRAAGPVTIDVLDIDGRRVRSLAQGTQFAAGRQQLRFDGADDGGRRLASGVYFYRVRTPYEFTTRRFAIVR